MFWIFGDGPEYFSATWDWWDGRERRDSQPDHPFRQRLGHFMQPG